MLAQFLAWINSLLLAMLINEIFQGNLVIFAGKSNDFYKKI